MPVGISEANYGTLDDSRLLPWTNEAIAGLGGEAPIIFKDTEGFDFEAISDCKPDIILSAFGGMTQEEYEILSEIAPTIAYSGEAYQSDWREVIAKNSRAIGMSAEGQQLITNIEQQVAAEAAKYPKLKGKTAVFGYVNPADLSKIGFYTPGDQRPSFLRDLGMVTPASWEQLTAQEESFWLEVSAEQADAFDDIDIIVLYGDDALLKAMQADPLLGQIPAVQRGSVALITDGSPLAASCSPSALSLPWATPEYVKLLAEAADKVG
jgi:iron complex transport system substrate-binding protein